MMSSPVLDAFPTRALKAIRAPDHARNRRIGFLIVFLLILPSVFLFYKVALEDALRADLRSRGVETEILRSDGSCMSRRQITGKQPLGCNYTIIYRTRPEHGGEERTADVRLKGSAPIFTPAAVYDPADSSRVMLKPEVERDADLDEFVLALVLLLPPAALLLWFVAGRRRLANAARDPRPLLVEINHVVGVQKWVEYWVRADGQGKPVRNVLPSTQRPFLVRPPETETTEKPWALALLDRRGRPLVMDEDLTQLDFTEDEKRALRAAAYS